MFLYCIAASDHYGLLLVISYVLCFLWLDRNLKIGYFSQHHVDQLDLDISATELLAKKFPGELEGPVILIGGPWYFAVKIGLVCHSPAFSMPCF